MQPPSDPGLDEVASFLDPTFRRVVHPAYLRILAKHREKVGRFAFVCARCRKPVGKISRLYLDRSSGFGYGTDCWAAIQDKQRALQTHRTPDGGVRPAAAGELVDFRCVETGATFRALPENRRHCGVEPISCAACPGASPKNRNRLCDFEVATRPTDEA